MPVSRWARLGEQTGQAMTTGLRNVVQEKFRQEGLNQLNQLLQGGGGPAEILQAALSANNPMARQSIMQMLGPLLQMSIMKWGPGERGINMFTGEEVVEPEYPPLKPKHQVGDTREIKKGNNIITEELTSEGWTEIARSPKWKGRKIGETRTFQRGGSMITQEWTKEGWKEIGKGPKFKPGTGVSKPPTEAQALKRISQIKKSIATFGRTGEVTQAIIAANPELAELLGRPINDAQKQDLMDQWNNELDYYSQFVSPKYLTGKKAQTPTVETKAAPEGYENLPDTPEYQEAKNKLKGQKPGEFKDETGQRYYWDGENLYKKSK